MPEKTCATCLVEHSEEIHEATQRLHAWLRERIQQHLRQLEYTEAEAA